MRRLLILLLAYVSLATAMNAQQARVPADYKRLLLPVHVSSPRWTVQWWFRNEGTQAVDAFPIAYRCGLPPPFPSAVIAAKPSMPAQTTLNCAAGDVLPTFLIPPFVPIVSSSPGAFLYVERSAADVTIGGTVYLSSRGERSSSAALEAIAEESFLTGTHSVLPVPVFANRRYAVRIYALPETIAASSRVHVNVYTMQPEIPGAQHEALHATYDAELQLPVSSVRPCANDCDVPALQYAPAVAEVFNLIGTFGARPAVPAARIEIVPESPSLRWWAVVSSTDNETHEINLYQPAH
jgi:hypothetical protein